MNNKILIIIFLCCTVFSIAGCGSDSNPVSDKVVKTSHSKNRSLVLFNWDNYIGSNTLADFEKETGISVILKTFESEGAMLGALQSDSGQFDLAVTSDDTLRELRDAKLVDPLDLELIPNFKHLDAKFLHQPWDPEQKYSIPYLTGTTGIVVNTKFVKDYEPSWKLLFDKRYSGRQALLDEPFKAIAAFVKVLGYPLNEARPEALLNIEKKIKEVVPRIHGMYTLDVMMDLMRREELWIGHIYSGEGMVLADENEAIKYLIPKEGSPLWVDMFFIPKGAKNIEAAHIFLDYILRPEVNASIASELWYATPNKTALQYIDPEVLASPSVNPPPEILKRCEMFRDIGETTRAYNRMWSMLQWSLKNR